MTFHTILLVEGASVVGTLPYQVLANLNFCLSVSGLLFVRRPDPVQVFHHEHAKRRSLQRLTNCIDVRLCWDNILGYDLRRRSRHHDPKIERTLASKVVQELRL